MNPCSIKESRTLISSTAKLDNNQTASNLLSTFVSCRTFNAISIPPYLMITEDTPDAPAVLFIKQLNASSLIS